MSAKLQPSVFQVGDLLVHRILLSKLLGMFGFSVLLLDDKDGALKYLEAQPVVDADFAIVDVCFLREPEVKKAKLIVRRLQKVAGIQVFGIFNSIESSPAALRELGITRAIDAFSTPEEVLDQVNGLLFKGARSRRHPRVFPYLPATFQADDKEFLARATSIGLGGMFLQTDTLYPVGMELPFKLAIGDSRVVEGTGRVIYVIKRSPVGNLLHMSGMGMQFVSLDSASAKIYASFYKSKTMKSSPAPDPGDPSASTPT